MAKALGGEVLREVSEEEFYKKIPELRKEVGDRAILRAIHFFDDNRVVDQEVAALKAGDFETFKQCVIASGYSSAMNLQNVFAVVNPQEQGLSLALALMAKILGGKGAYRVHGGGFARHGAGVCARSICWTRSRQRCRACLAKRAAMCSPCATRAARK